MDNEKSEKTFFPLLGDLLALERLSPKGIRKALKVDLVLRHSTKYFDIYAGGGSSDSDIGAVIKELELRFPRPQSRHNDGMLIIRLGSALDITPSQLMRRFGEPEISLVESPPGEPIVPKMYYTYRHPGGKLSFGISRESNKVIDLVIDRIKDA